MKDKFFEIFDYIKTSDDNTAYGTNNFAFYMYSLVKMIKPNNVIELGTGFGTNAYLCAQALKENNNGKLITVDDGSDHGSNYVEYIENKIKEFELENFIDFRNIKLDFDFEGLLDIQSVDIIFNDMIYGSNWLYGCLLYMLPRTDVHSYLIIDNGADWHVWSETELLVGALNRGEIPKKMYEMCAVESYDSLNHLIKTHSFYFDFFKKNVDGRHQNNFATIHISKKNHIYNIRY